MNDVSVAALSKYPRLMHAASALLGALVIVSLGTQPLNAAEEAKIKAETVMSVGIAQIALMTLNAHVAAYGTVESLPAGANQAPTGARVASPVAGMVVATPAFEGQSVKKGDVLVRLDTRAADAALAKAAAAVKVAEKAVSRQKDLLKAESTSDKLYQEAELLSATAQSDLVAARTLQSLLVVTAPFDGVITHVNIRPGETADPASPLVELFDPNQLIVTGSVPVDDSAALALSRPVEISTNVANSKVTGSLLYISPQVDPKTGTVTVRASVPANSGFHLGQFVKLYIATEEHRDVMSVPVESIVKDPDIGYVMAFVEGNKATEKPVRVGVRDGDFIEVDGEGVKVGQTVVSYGAYALPKVSKIKVVTPDN